MVKLTIYSYKKFNDNVPFFFFYRLFFFYYIPIFNNLYEFNLYNSFIELVNTFYIRININKFLNYSIKLLIT